MCKKVISDFFLIFPGWAGRVEIKKGWFHVISVFHVAFAEKSEQFVFFFGNGGAGLKTNPPLHRGITTSCRWCGGQWCWRAEAFWNVSPLYPPPLEDCMTKLATCAVLSACWQSNGKYSNFLYFKVLNSPKFLIDLIRSIWILDTFRLCLWMK